MAKEVITVDGKDVVVREDMAKAYRFLHWGVITAEIGLGIMVIVFAIFFLSAASDGQVESPPKAANSDSR